MIRFRLYTVEITESLEYRVKVVVDDNPRFESTLKR